MSKSISPKTFSQKKSAPKVQRTTLRPLGDILLDMEPLLIEMCDQHELQWGDVLGLVFSYMQIHLPGAQETYSEDGSHPIMYYGPRE